MRSQKERRKIQNQQNINQIKTKKKTNGNLNLRPSTTKRSQIDYIRQRERNDD